MLASFNDFRLQGLLSDITIKRTFHYEKSFLKHRSTYHGMAAEMVHRCEICQQTFANRSNMKTHERHVHSSERLFSCIICSKTFKRKKDVVRHQRQVHERDNQKYVCSVCGKSLSCKAGLQLHERIHNGTKPYQCSLCESKFTQKTALNMHYRTHTGERPFACTMCDSRFTQKHMLTNHIRSHTGEKPYMCELCGKSFSSREYLRHHLNIHTGAKPFKCEHCQRGFSQRNSLNQHLKIHTGDRPYSCTSCEKQFTQLNALQRHQRIHTGEKPFMCNMCNRTFTDKSTLRRHTTTHSSDAPWTSFLVVLEGNIEDKRLPSEQKNIAADNKSKKSPERRTEDEDEGVKLQTQPETTESSTEASTEATTEATTVAIPPDWASHGAIALVSHAALGGLTVIQTEIPAGTKLQEMVTSDSTGAHLLTLADSAVTAPFSLASTMGQSISATDIPTVSIANGALTIVSESQSVCTPSVLEVAASQTILASDTDGKANDEDILVPNAEIETVVETEASVEMEAVKEDDEDEEGKKP
uniref:C2H2-type domain-containing protein n=1 Tax=Knipowitschia caucasica TaxID=637954 RepID=A0AAV2K8C9_KNICA